MNLTETIAPRSDQTNSDDLMAGPRTFTIESVTAGSPEQPVNVNLVEHPGRPWRPSKSMRRVLVAAWGPEADVYAGRRVTLYRNPDIKFGRDVVGGIEVSHLSHLTKPLNLALTATRGKKRAFTVQPLPDSTPAAEVQPDWAAEVAKAEGDAEILRALWTDAQKRGASQGVLDMIRDAAQTTPQNDNRNEEN